MSRIDQVIGRGVRFKSHQDLPVEKRKVDIYLHVSEISDPSILSIDNFKYKICQIKDYNIKKIEKIIKLNSFDCFLNKQRNLKLSSSDFTRDCQYDKCIYTCPFEAKEPLKTEKSTYNIEIHSKEEYKFIKKVILDLFKKISVINSSILVNYVRNYEEKNYNAKTIYKNNIYYVLDKMVSENEIIQNRRGQPCVIIKVKNYYIANPKDSKIKESFYKKLFIK